MSFSHLISSNLQVLHIISNKDNSGGTVAAMNLHYALTSAGVKSSVLSNAALEGYERGGGYRKYGGIIGRLQSFFLGLENKLAKPGWVNPLDKVVSPKVLKNFKGVVHIHVTHVAQISFGLLRQLCCDNKVVWTLHDMWPLTAKCIHPIDCKKYLSACHSCPKLNEYPKLNWDNTPYLHAAKQVFIRKNKVQFIAPSNWIIKENNAYINSLNGSISVIPHGIDTNIFKPLDQRQLRLKYNLPIDGDLILFPQGRWDDPKKGGEWYAEIKKLLTESKSLNGKIYLLRLGNSQINNSIEAGVINEINLPTTFDKSVMAEYYNIADATFSLSEIETFGLCVAESLACNTPVFARSAKGVNELLNEQVIGESPTKLAEFILNRAWLSTDLSQLYKHVTTTLTTDNWAASHIKLYENEDI